jgi:hypothetical protein
MYWLTAELQVTRTLEVVISPKAQADFASTIYEAGRNMLHVLSDATQNLAQGQTAAVGQQVQRPKPRGGR